MRRKVKEMMTGISNLAIVTEDSTLFEAILAIGAVRNKNPGCGLRCPAALVSDGNRRIIGFLDFRSMLKSLEPRYAEIAESIGQEVVAPGWIQSELKKHGLWADALDDVCRKAGEIVIKNLMTVPEDDQVTNTDATLNEAVFQMVVTGNDYLFVRDGEVLAGIISLSEIVTHVCQTVKGCRI